MRRLGFLLRPGWLALVAGVVLFAGACFWILSPWQFGRNEQRQTQINTLSLALRAQPVALTTFLPGDGEPTAAQEWFPVSMSGHYLPAGEAVVRLRELDLCENCAPSPVFEVLTPFQLDDGTVVLIDRGYVPPNNDQVPDYPAAPRQHVALLARVHPDEPTTHRAPLRVAGHREVYEINSTVLSQDTGLTLRRGYFQLVDNQPGALGITPPPTLDSGPFLSYAWQWITFGLMAIGGLGYFTWRELKPGGALTPEGRARRRAERALLAEQENAAGKPTRRRVRGRRAVAALIAEEEARERAEGVSAVPSSGEQRQ